MISGYANIFVFSVFAIIFVFIALLFSRLVAPFKPTKIKSQTYECGEKPVGQAWVNFNARFYIIALIFLIFDVEIAFIFPVAVSLSDWVKNNQGLFALIEIFIFIFILIFGLIYVWKKGDINWIRLNKDKNEKI